jgi:hypothetical protein
MMNDCNEIEIREALPEMVHGGLDAVVRGRVQLHLDQCADCTAELAIIRAVLSTSVAPRVDVARIVSAVPPYRRKTSRMRKVYLELAAACLIGAVGISTLVAHNSHPVPAVVQGRTASLAPGLAIVNTSDLSDAGLEQLTRELDKFQALPTADPESVTPVALQDASDQLVPGDST